LSVSLPWNTLIAEGLLAYGFRAEATRLTAHLMNAVIQNLKQNRAFYQRYHAETGAGIGERNSLTGFAPVGLFMQALGVTILSVHAGAAGRDAISSPGRSRSNTRDSPSCAAGADHGHIA
jgi:hypothetical protein